MSGSAVVHRLFESWLLWAMREPVSMLTLRTRKNP